MSKPKLPVAGPRFDEDAVVLTAKQADVLASAWVSAANRLGPEFLSAPDERDGAWQHRQNPSAALFIVDVIAWIVDKLRRRSNKADLRETFDLSKDEESALRASFQAEFSRSEVRAMHDAEQRSHLGGVLFERAQRLR